MTDRRPAASVTPRTIVCAVDLTPQGDVILKWAADLASDLQAGLIVSHAIPPLETRLETQYLETDMRGALVGDARAWISNVLEGSRVPGAEVRVEVGSVPEVVHSVVEDCRADLLIIGRASSQRALGRLRTHSYALIRESACPVISI